MPTHLSTNLALLRKRKGRSQQDVADVLDIRRSRYSGYELGTAEPSLDILVQLATYMNVSVHRLLIQDMRDLSAFDLGTIDRGYDHKLWQERQEKPTSKPAVR